jgi:hypothetical protein
MGGIIAVGSEYSHALAVTFAELGEKLSIDAALLTDFPELIFCHPAAIRSEPNYLTKDLMRVSDQRPRIIVPALSAVTAKI